MKYPTKYRYVVWDADGMASSYENPPFSAGGMSFWRRVHYVCAVETSITHMCPGTWNKVVLDMEVEEDRRYVEAFVLL